MSKGRRKTTKTAPATTANIIQGDPPEWMALNATMTWHRTLHDLEEAGRTLDMLDLEAFTTFCVSAGIVRQCSEIIAREGVTVSGGRDGTRKHPACSTMNAAASQVRQYAAELGLTAASRGRLPAPAFDVDRAASEEIRRKDPNGYAQFVKQHGRPPTNIYEVL